MDTTSPDTPTTATIRGIVKSAVLAVTGDPDGDAVFDCWLNRPDAKTRHLTLLVERGRTTFHGDTDPRLEELPG